MSAEVAIVAGTGGAFGHATAVMTHAIAPEAITGVIVFLVSDAAALVSGAIPPTDGA